MDWQSMLTSSSTRRCRICRGRLMSRLPSLRRVRPTKSNNLTTAVTTRKIKSSKNKRIRRSKKWNNIKRKLNRNKRKLQRLLWSINNRSKLRIRTRKTNSRAPSHSLNRSSRPRTLKRWRKWRWKSNRKRINRWRSKTRRLPWMSSKS